MTKIRKKLTDKERLEIIEKCSNSCCICQTPFIQVHHIDENPSNNDPDNLVPLCPNCHNIAHGKGHLTMDLNEDRLKKLRDMWYKYCEERKSGSNFSGTGKLLIKKFVRDLGQYGAAYGWAKTFSSLDPDYKDMKVDEIIDAVFTTTNPDNIFIYLELVKQMYEKNLSEEKYKQSFERICNAFGISYEDLN